MDADILEAMKAASEKDEPMTPRTIRLSNEIDQQIRQFAKREGIKLSVVFRTLIELGWGQLK